ncbi:MAG: hypothetical protein J07HQW2_03828 [Haloquadratum walsbyi J07HQW2]|jgi:hypothetical protein|uniref:Uncharacterized protein n=1 Tax=Haloquadratum walsbyi J07HQW2 TaxID=1238425 RepID=U1PU60_9EURY|nr:MAG: hypothetical protein J07HQW2_03828 [Haloquadratum walsbyi J07HQW2]
MGQGQSSSLTGKMTIQALVEKAEDVFLPVNDEIPRPLQIGEDVFVLELVYFVGDYDAVGVVARTEAVESFVARCRLSVDRNTNDRSRWTHCLPL